MQPPTYSEGGESCGKEVLPGSHSGFTCAGRCNGAGLRPDPTHPINQGTLCPKGATAYKFIDNPERLTQPQLRKGGMLLPASWDETYDYIAREFKRIIHHFGPESIGLISSARATTEENYLTQKFARAVLGTNHIDNCFRICHSATAIGLKQVLGNGAMTNSIAEFLDPSPKVIIIIGSNTPHSHPIIWSVWIKKAVKNGTKLIVIDPRVTEPAKPATLYLQIKHGTEIALFNAMAQHIFSKKLCDEKFIADHCEGFGNLQKVLNNYRPDMVEGICGVPARQIRDAAEMYASERPASIVYGLGVTEHRSGLENVQALNNLCLMTGNIGKESAGINALRGQNNVQGATDMCAPEWLPGYQSWDDPVAIKMFETTNFRKLPRSEKDLIFSSRM
jgi:predicted molibdopterin-dependent oxidoreductase YjgC